MRSSLPHVSLLVAVLTLGVAGPAVADSAGQAVEFAAPDGVQLRATYWSAGKPGPGVLLLHMCNSDRRAWSGLGQRLAARGLHALALDYRGYGESAGERSPDPQTQQRNITDNWPGDVDAGYEFLRSKLGSDAPILGAAGGSCGVNQSIQLARRHPEVRTLALLAGNTNRAGEEFLAATPWMPLLAAAARDDDGAVEGMRWVIGFSGHAGNVLKEYADGGHGTAIFARHADLEPTIADWFVRHLVTSPVRPEPAAPVRPSSVGPSAELAALLRSPGGVAALRARHAAAQAKREPSQYPPEEVVNRLGYEMLQNGNAAQAIELFELNVELHPDSANTYDSLADGFVAAGKPDLARQQATKAIARLPADPAEDDPGQKAIRDSAQAKLRVPATSGGS